MYRNIKVKKNLRNASLDEAMDLFGKGECSDSDLIDYLEVNEDASLELFKCFYITDLDDILNAIDAQKEIWEDVKTDGRVHSPQFFDRLFCLLKEFREEVENAYLFDKTPDWWAYSIYVDSSGISLHLDYYADREARPHLAFENSVEPDIEPDQEYTLIKVESKLLKVEEYAAMFNVDPPAVRQWIRRGKLPEAIKFGREWRIPELCDVGGRTYYQRQYFWKTELTDLTEEYKFLNEYRSVILQRDRRDKKKYVAEFLGGKDAFIVDKELSIKERENLEMVLISNPLVYVDSTCLAHIVQKHGQGVYLVPFDGSDDNELLRREPIEK